jgi:Na+/phosphate symporter
MGFQQHFQLLRAQLLGMARLSHRALDHSIKGYQLGNLDFCNHVSIAEGELERHSSRIRRLCLRLVTTATTPSDFRFILSTLRISRAFHRTYHIAARMAQESVHFLAANSTAKHARLDEFGDLVNGLTRLSVVALFEKEARHAETVLQSQGVWRRCELIFSEAYFRIDHQDQARDLYELTITRHLGAIAKQAHKIAEALLFWLRGKEGTHAFESDGHGALDHLFAASRISVESKYRPATYNPFARSNLISFE